MSIKIENLSKKFKSYEVLKNINLEINEGELVALLGPSGSGKTTLLRVIAGLEFPDEGVVYNFGENTKTIDRKKRNIGFVFQHYALFKHMTVYENIAFGLKMQRKKLGITESQIREKVESLLKLVHLENFHDRYPKQLSGGQRQRVALARSLAIEPKILLLDEPFGALDLKVRKELRRWLRNLHERLKITTIFVTHDQEEAMEVADRVLIMSDGKIEQDGSPTEVYEKPSNSFVYDFLGNFNVFLGWKSKSGEISLLEYSSVDNFTKRKGWFSKGKFVSNVLKIFKSENYSEKNKSLDGSYVEIFVRPHDMEIIKDPDENKEYIPVKISHVNPAGPMVRLEFERADKSILYAELTHEEYNALKVDVGAMVFTRVKEFTVFE